MKPVVFLMALAAFTSTMAKGAPLCVAAPFSTYTTAGFECEINGAVFSDFTYPATPNGGDLDASDITVSPLVGLNSVGLRFAAAFLAQGTASNQVVEQYRFIYNVAIAGALFTAATTTINAGSVFSPNAAEPGGYLAATSIANDGATAIVNTATAGQSETNLLFSARANIVADTLAQLGGGSAAVGTASPVGTAQYASFDNIFTYEATAVPEPGTAAMLLLAFASCLLLRKAT